MGRRIVLEEEKCVGCHLCQLVCSTAWQRVFNPEKANLRIVEDGFPEKFTARICIQKEDGECIKVCPTGALYWDASKKIVAYDKDKCNSCGECVDACPYDAIFTHPEIDGILKCDLCHGAKVQQCVTYCPREALRVEEV